MRLDGDYGKSNAMTDQKSRSLINNFFRFFFREFQYTDTASTRNLQLGIVCSSTAIGQLFILFNLGQIFHSKLMGMSTTIYQTEWYRYPRNIQYFVLFMMKRSQQLFYLSAFGLMALNLQNYVGVSMKRCEDRLDDMT